MESLGVSTNLMLKGLITESWRWVTNKEGVLGNGGNVLPEWEGLREDGFSEPPL